MIDQPLIQMNIGLMQFVWEKPSMNILSFLEKRKYLAMCKNYKYSNSNNYKINSNRNERKKEFMAKTQPIKKNRESI